MSTLEDDIHFVRQLAESGTRAPLLGGRFLVWWGGLIGLAYGAHFVLQEYPSLAPSVGFAWLWIGFGVIAPLGYWLIGRHYPFRLPGSGSHGNQVDRVVWSTAGLMLLSLVLGAVLRVVLGDSPRQVFPWTVPGVFAGFAIAQFATGWIAQNRLLKGAGLMAMVGVGASFALVGHSFLFAFAAAGTLLTVFVPGVVLWREESGSLEPE